MADYEPPVHLDSKTFVRVPCESLIGLVIGKQGRTIKRLMRETESHIYYDVKTTSFVIEGIEEQNELLAKLKIKEILSNGLKTRTANYVQCKRFPFVDSNEERFQLDPVGNGIYSLNVVPIDSSVVISRENADYSALSMHISQVLQSIYIKKNPNTITNIWTHFGHIYIGNVDQQEEKTKTFSHQDIKNHLLWETRSNATRWQSKFDGGIKKFPESQILNEWMAANNETCAPYIRYEFLYYTPSCNIIRLKVFVSVDASNPNALVFKNIPRCEAVANILKCSDTYPYFYLCGPTTKRAMIDVFEPSEQLDFRWIINTGSNSSSCEETDEEVQTLFEFIRNHMKISREYGVEVPLENLPDDFDPGYARVSERRTYSFVSDGGVEFTVKLCYENFINRPTAESDTTIDIHLQYDKWNEMFDNGTWDPQMVVDEIPEFMKCARQVARTFKVQDTIPQEVLLRGPQAKQVYEMALKKGKTKNLRVLVMFIGQSRAGKTSLLKSLKGEKFNPDEDSTIGAKLHRGLSRLEETGWAEEEISKSFYTDATAKAIANKLKSPKPGVLETQADNETTSLYQNEKELALGEIPHKEKLESTDCKHEETQGFSSGADNLSEAALPPTSPISVPRTQGSPADEIPDNVTEKTRKFLEHPEKEEQKQFIYGMTIDFAGQPVYTSTHPVFLSPKGIYVLVHNLENDEHAQANPVVKHGSVERKIDDCCPMTNMNHLEYWASFIASYLSSNVQRSVSIGSFLKKEHAKEAKLPKKLPPVFLVCTHADSTYNKQPADEMARRILESLKQQRDKDTTGEHIVRAIYPVNNTISGSEAADEYVKKLRADICRAAKCLPHVNEDIPIRWLRFEEKLSKLVEKGNKYIEIGEVNEVAEKCQISTETDELMILLNYLHDLKVIVYFEVTNIVIIDVQWLLEMIVKVITVPFFEDLEEEYAMLWEKLENEGILDQNLVNHVWNNDDKTTAESLLMIMEKFSLLCRWKQSDGLEEVFLVPPMLMNADAKEADQLLSDKKTSTLVVRFRSTHLPLGIFPRLLVIIARRCNEEWPTSPQPKFFHNFCRFFDIGGERDQRFDLVVTSDLKTISIGIINEHGIREQLVRQLCRYLATFLGDTLNDMRTSFSWMANIEVDFCIRCPVCLRSLMSKACKLHGIIGCIRDACLHFIVREDLEREQPRCLKNPLKIDTIIERDAYSNWFTKKSMPSDSLPAVQSDTSEGDIQPPCKEIVALIGPQVSLNDISAKQAAKMIAEKLNLDRISMRDPPVDAVKKCRLICSKCKEIGRRDIIKELRDVLPSGMTGPLLEPDDCLYEDIDESKKQKLTKSLCAPDMWKKIADKLDIPNSEFDFYSNFSATNPVQEILKEVCSKRRLTVKDLYDVLVACGACATADKFL